MSIFLWTKGWVIKINCELCGRTEENLFRTLIEEVELSVCQDCSKFGKVLGPIRRETPNQIKKTGPQEEKVALLVENYADIIRKKRDSMGLTQKDFANKLNEKESIIHKLETGAFEPSLVLAKKLEKALGIRLIEEYTEKSESMKRKKDEGFTLGDFIKLKK